MKKRVLVTGASCGIGRAVAELLVADGFEVWGTARQASSLPVMEAFHPVMMDLCDPASIDAGFRKAELEAGSFDILINNAGAGIFGPSEHLPPEALREQFELLCFGPMELIRRVLPAMRQRESGVIVNVTSLAVRLPIPFFGAYTAAKAALSSFSASLALELTGTGVRLVDLQPGDIRTDFNDAAEQIESGDYATSAGAVWENLERERLAAPAPDLVARAILRQIRNPESRVAVGGFFQTRLALLAVRFLPWSVMLVALRNYFGLRGPDPAQVLNSRLRNESQAPASRMKSSASSVE